MNDKKDIKQDDLNVRKESFQLEVIGEIKSSFKEKFGVPRQSGLTPSSRGEIIFFPPFNNKAAFDGLEDYSHIWIQFIFHKNLSISWRPKVRPPRLGGNEKVGVFATRSPVRPNPIGLSVVELKEVVISRNTASIVVAGADLVDGTPILDIKPYIPYADSLPDAKTGFADGEPQKLAVEFSGLALTTLEKTTQTYEQLKPLIVEMLQQDPRPQYQTPDSDRIYGVNIENCNVCWRYLPLGGVDGDQRWKIEVVSIEEIA